MVIVKVNLNEIIGRHPRYDDLFVPKVIDELSGLKSSILSNEKLNPVHLMKPENAQSGYYIIDGASTITVYEATGKNTLYAIVHDWCEDPINLMIDLNTNEHRKSKEQYMLAEALYELIAPGQGKRTDLRNGESENTYDRIAKRLKLDSGTQVKKLLRVGRTQESYFTDIDSGYTALDRAYRDCVSIEKKIKESNEIATDDNFVSTSSDIPEFTEPGTTGDSDLSIKYEYEDGLSKNLKMILKNFQKLTDDEIRNMNYYFSSVTGTCVCCGRENNSNGTEGLAS